MNLDRKFPPEADPPLAERIKNKDGKSGFTLMEIMVATVIFAVMASATLSLFNYVLRINRRTEALRQAAQGARDFVEFIVKEVRNGQIDYYVANGSVYTNGIGPCVPPGTVGSSPTGAATYNSQDNRLGIINTDNVQECFYYGTASSTWVGLNHFTAASGGNTLVLQKNGVTGAQVLNPPNFRVDNLMFLIRPLKDPYTQTGGLAKVQPFVTIIIKFVVQLPTGEQVPIYYQTSVSSDKYDIPNS
jgi:prepilin-type N-terminal cleavage/methylation domain-containing protein